MNVDRCDYVFPVHTAEMLLSLRIHKTTETFKNLNVSKKFITFGLFLDVPNLDISLKHSMKFQKFLDTCEQS